MKPIIVIICIVARVVSTSLPLKVLRNIRNKDSILDVLIKRLKIVPGIDRIYLCTSREKDDDILEDVAEINNINIYRDSSEDDIERLLAVARIEDASHIVWVNGDNVFTDPYILKKQINFHINKDLEYTRTEKIPLGVTAEIIKVKSLVKIKNIVDPQKKENLMQYTFNPELYKCGVMLPDIKDIERLEKYTLTVDSTGDLYRSRKIAYYAEEKSSYINIGLKNIVEIIEKYRIDNAENSSPGSIKLSSNRFVTYEIFRNDIKKRINKACICYFKLEDV